MSGGRISIARRMMNRCASQLHAVAGAGRNTATIITTIIAAEERRIMQVYYQRDGQPHAYPVWPDAVAHAAGTGGPRGHYGARTRVKRARHRHHHDRSGRRVVPAVASWSDPRSAR